MCQLFYDMIRLNMNLDLRAPLVYAKIDEIPPELGRNALPEGNGEFLLCFDLDLLQSRSIEPDPRLLPGALVFVGRKGGSEADNLIDPALTVSLPAGNYLFVQQRGAVMGREEWLDMAIEQQKDGLWEMFRPEARIFVRYLYEDGQPVTQLFRPLPG